MPPAWRATAGERPEAVIPGLGSRVRFCTCGVRIGVGGYARPPAAFAQLALTRRLAHDVAEGDRHRPRDGRIGGVSGSVVAREERGFTSRALLFSNRRKTFLISACVRLEAYPPAHSARHAPAPAASRHLKLVDAVAVDDVCPTRSPPSPAIADEVAVPLEEPLGDGELPLGPQPCDDELGPHKL